MDGPAMSKVHVLYTKAGKGNYVALLAGVGGRFGILREWVKGTNLRTPDGAALGRRQYTVTEPGFYEVQEIRSTGRRRSHFIWTGTEVVPVSIPDPTDLKAYVRLTEAGVAGPGDWFSDRCECGGEVTRYDNLGLPYCEDHEDLAA